MKIDRKNVIEVKRVITVEKEFFSFRSTLLSNFLVFILGFSITFDNNDGIESKIAVKLIIIIVKGEQIAVGVLNKIEAQGGAIDAQTISDVVNRAVTASDNLIIKGAFFFIVLCWIVSIIDAYSVGRKIDIKEAQESQKE